MIPILYQENETNFNHNGIGILFDTKDYTVTEERNGPYELELVYPAGGRWANELKDFRFISAKPNDEEDSHIFRIYETVKNLEEDTITVYAATKSNELGGNLVQDVSVTDVNAQQALNAIKAGLTQATSYNFISDIQTTSSGKWDKQSPLSAIVGSDGSVVSKWGGELKRTNDTIYLYGRRGTNKVTTIRQGKGLIGFKMTTSIKGLVTTILPYFTYTPSDSDTPVTIKGSLVNSSLMGNYPVRYISAVDFSNHDGIAPTTEGLTPEQYSTQVLNNLNTVASAYFVYMNPGCDKPKVTIEVDLAQLSDSSEYEQFRKLEHIALTDTVVVWVEKFNVDVEVTINEVTYNGMSERVTKFVAGSAKSGIIQDSEKRYTEQIDKIVEYVNTVENGIYNSIRISADSKNNIFSGYTTPDESLVKFDDIWYKPVADGEIEMYRWDGDSWVLAVTNADRIAIGTLDASRINVVNLNASNLSTGTVTGASGGWNLVTGEFWLGSSKANSKFLWDGDSLTIKVGSGQTVEEYVSNAIVATDVEYYLSTSSTALSGGSWSTTAPAWVDGKFMWSRTKVTFKSGTVQYRPSTTGVCIAGAKGATGDQGPQGIQGPVGPNGQTLYTWIKYADTPTSGMNDSPTGKTYIGLAYNKVNSTESSNYTDYSWSLIKGDQGIQGPQGPNGQTLYTWIKYSASSDGTNPVDNPTGAKYIGIAYNKTTATESTNKTDYAWSLIEGPQGQQGPQGIQGPAGAQGKGISSTVVTYQASASGTTAPTGTWSGTIPSVAENQYLWTRTVITYTDAQTTTAYSVGKMGAKGETGNTGATGSQGPAGKGISGTTVTYQASASGTTAPTGTWSATVPTVTADQYLWTRIVITYTDTTSTTSYAIGKMGAQGPQGAKGDTGATGATGAQGPKGDTGTSVTGVTEYYLATSAASGVTTATAGWTTTMQTMTTTNKYLWNYEVISFSDGSTSPTIPVIIGVYGNTGSTGATGRSLTAVTEYYLASASASGVTRATAGWTTTMQTTDDTKKYLWNYEKLDWSSGTTPTYVEPIIIGIHGAKGNTGATGATGTGITSITEEYYLSTSKSTQTGGSWVTSPPAWVNGSYLWTRSKIVYSNPTSTVYTTPVVSSEWEAVTDLEFGGRNLLKDSGRLVQNANYGMADYYFTVPPLAGEKVTITLKGLLAATKSYFAIYNSGGSVPLATLVNKGNGIYQATFDWVIGGSSNTYITVYAFTSAQTGTSRIDWIKLEKGNTPTDWSPAPEELYTGITRIDKDGINVSKSTSDVNSQLAHDGLTVRDGDTPIAIFGEAGAVIPTIDSNVLNFGDKTGQYQVGSSHQFKSITECLEYLFPRNNRIHIGEARGAQQADIWIIVNTEINETVRITGLSGRGRLIINIAPNVKFNGNFELFGNLLPIYIIAGGSGATIKNPGTVSGYMFQVSACAYVQVSGLNLDNNGGYYLSATQHGSKLHFQSVDVVRANFMVEGDNNSSVAVINSKGNVTSGVLRLTEGAIGYLSGSIPAGGVEDYSTNKFVWKDGTVNRVASSYSPPAVTNKTFVQTFTGGIFDTLQHGTSNVSAYYGASAAQNRWDSSVGWVDGRVRFGSEVYNFFNGGSNISIRMRLRRKNSSHGSSGAVMPAPYNHSASFPSGATRGGWTGWATIPSSLFTSSGATLTYYNGVQGVNGYAIWDAIEVEVTVTKSV